ncbi:PREDICTED: polygalacturonase QRT2-like [Camelina sativa]|uniref:Polygalacturonase QRT2-like n=1 Tax=Camelina sativa TaxID=90675 RepID=A0ABM0SZ16_CAMSA|nr:PREDICTED: polygalacturonase QRT2-like [Camelina sativa]
MYEKFIILSAFFLTFLPSCFSSYPYNHRDADPFMSSDVYYETNHLHGHITRSSHTKNRHGNYAPRSSPQAFNVNSFGAKANGNDDSQAFMKAWQSACSSTGIVYIVVPNNRKYMLKPVQFSGPCKSSLIVFKIYGMIEAWENPSDYKVRRHWIVFENHVSGTRNILIQDSVIRTGDDCISIVSGSENVRATGITCGPGHGISIGSLGEGNSEAYVSNVVVNKATLIGTTNGVRIKTWQGGRGMAKNIIFQDIIMKNVTNPIIINQDYCDRVESCPEQKSAVQVSNVLYKNIQGTSSRPVAVNFACSKSIPCRGISMQNVKLVDQTQQDVSKASCSNVRLNTLGNVSPLYH